MNKPSTYTSEIQATQISLDSYGVLQDLFDYVSVRGVEVGNAVVPYFICSHKTFGTLTLEMGIWLIIPREGGFLTMKPGEFRLLFQEPGQF